MREHKPTIETLINTAAIALTATGTSWLVASRDWWGFLLILFGLLIEWFKYFGRERWW